MSYFKLKCCSKFVRIKIQDKQINTLYVKINIICKLYKAGLDSGDKIIAVNGKKLNEKIIIFGNL